MTSLRSDAPSEGDTPGFRAAEAYVRPSPMALCGDHISSGFDLRNAVFRCEFESPNGTTENTATEIFLPEFHFPRERTEVEVSDGKWTIAVDDTHGAGLQRLFWWHGEGKQSITVRGVKRQQGVSPRKEEEESGYWQQCRQNGCHVM